MPARGQPFDPSKGKRRMILHCPCCGEAMIPRVIVSLGPADLHGGSKPLDPPYYRYSCQRKECGYVEVQGHLILVEEDHP